MTNSVEIICNDIEIIRISPLCVFDASKPITASQTIQKLQHDDNKPTRLFHTTALEINNL